MIEVQGDDRGGPKRLCQKEKGLGPRNGSKEILFKEETRELISQEPGGIELLDLPYQEVKNKGVQGGNVGQKKE